MVETRLLLADIDIPDIERLEIYRAQGGYNTLEQVLRTKRPNEVVEAVQASGLQDRGGAWYGLGARWRQVGGRARYLCVNANESSPGTFRDRKLIERHPHQFLEGVILAAYALGVSRAYVYMRPEMRRGVQLLENAVREAQQAGYLGERILGHDFALEVVVFVGGGAYIAGEETALLASLEGRRAEPRPQPPAAWQRGLWGDPALVENAGTLCYLPHILSRGAEWFRQMGTERYPGTLVFCVSGHVRRPGLYELELGRVTLRQLIDEYAGGVRAGHQLKAVIPGGGASPPLLPQELDVRLSPEDWVVPGGGQCPGSFATGGVIVMDDTVCMVDAALNLMQFYARESCAACPPCRTGTPWLRDILKRLECGQGCAEDLELLREVASQVSPLLAEQRSTLCAFGQEFAWPLQGFLQRFADEFALHIQRGACPVNKDLSIKTPETVSVRF